MTRLIAFRCALERVLAVALVAWLLMLMVLSCSGCASLSQLADSAVAAQREVDRTVQKLQYLEALCEAEPAPKTEVCKAALEASAAVRRLLARLPVEIPGDVGEVQP